jgi:hypothetical protein
MKVVRVFRWTWLLTFPLSITWGVTHAPLDRYPQWAWWLFVLGVYSPALNLFAVRYLDSRKARR